MKKLLLYLTIALTLAGTLIPAKSVSAAIPDAPLRDLVTTNDNNQLITYSGTWTHATGLSGRVSEDQHASNTTSNFAQFTFFGRSVSLVVTTDANSGQADVYIDTVLQETVDMYSAAEAYQQTIYTKSGLTQASHTIKVVVKGTKHASSGGYTVNVDAFRYEDAAVQDPPATNEIECRAQQGTYFQCTQLDTQHITIVATVADEHYQPRWKLNTGGIGTVYARMTAISVYWNTSVFSQGGTFTFEFDVVGGGSGNVIRNIGTYWPGGSGTISVADFEGEAVVGAAGNYETEGRPGYGAGHIGSTSPTFVLQLQTVPFEDECTQQYTVLMSDGPYLINPTIETPLGPTGSPADEQMYPVIEGYQYMLRVGGNGWHDGTSADTWASAYSWDGTTWHNATAAPCVSQTDGYYKYTAVTENAPVGATHIYIHAGDDPGDFASNYMDANETFIYTVSLVIFTGVLDCDSQFTYDAETDLVASVTVPANTSYTLASDEFTHGEWYVIEVASGSWKDGGTGPDLYEGQFSWGNVMDGSASGGTWANIAADGTGVYCETESGNYATVYTQAQGWAGSNLAANMYLRVADPGQTFTGNTGSLTINIYAASFERRPTTCELTFDTAGFIGTSEIPANAENGITIGISSSSTNISVFGSFRMEQGAWYMIETKDGPWGWVGSTHSALSYDLQVYWGNEWTPLEQWSLATCVVPLDASGHVRVYFQTPATGAGDFKFRVADTATWFNNIGVMRIDMYASYQQNVDLPGGGCDYTYDGDPVQGPSPIVVQGNDADGEYIGNILTAGNIYAFVMEGSDYSWQESTGGANLYAMQMSPDNGTSWYDVPNGYGAVLCYVQNGNDTIMFVKAGFNYLYRFRVDSESFANNTGSMGINIYGASMGDTIDPWQNCVEGQAKHPITAFDWIPVYAEDGKALAIVDSYVQDQDVSGFVVEIKNGPWDDGETTTEHYDAELSSDNGATWYPLDQSNPDLICADWADPPFLKRYAFAYFAFTEGDVWKIRVNDEDTSTFTDNTGNLAYSLYAVTSATTVPDCLVDTNNPECIPWDEIPSGILIDGVDICAAALPRPEAPDSIDVPAWLNYVAGWVVFGAEMGMQYLAWCPRHTDALMGLLDVFRTREPIATFNELYGLMITVRTQLEAYNWSDTGAEASPIMATGGGDAAATSVLDRMFSTENSPWTGGPLITMTEFQGNIRYNDCVTNFVELINNEGLTSGVCFISASAADGGFFYFLQLMLELATLVFCLSQIASTLNDLAFMMSSGTQAHR